MPIYEYQCESCEELTEAIQRSDEAPLAICPHCGGPLVKLMSAPSFQFKGTGWYVTDYGASKGKGAGSGGEAPASDGESGKSETSGSSGGESKSTAKTSSAKGGSTDKAGSSSTS